MAGTLFVIGVGGSGASILLGILTGRIRPPGRLGEEDGSARVSVKSVPRVTVYVPCRNYGRFLAEALESVVHQSMDDWELIVFTEGSTDETAAVGRAFRERFPERIRVVETAEARGLRACANAALEAARGEYIIRLDADDYLDENALLVLVHHLDHHPEVGLVHSNWTYVTEAGDVIAIAQPERRFEEVGVPDLPPPGACTLVRRRVLKALGGYDPRFTAQDGYELWFRALSRFHMAKVQTSLFYYRQHATSMSRNAPALLAARRAIKRDMVSRFEGMIRPRCLAVVTGLHSVHSTGQAGLPRDGLCERIDAVVSSIQAAGVFSLVYVSTDDPAVATRYAGRQGVVAKVCEPRHTHSGVDWTSITRAAVDDVEIRLDHHADIVVIASPDAPLPSREHLVEAIDTLMLHDVDQVVSTSEVEELLLRHGRQGMERINPGVLLGLRVEHDAVFAANGSILAVWRDALRRRGLYEGRIGQIVMTRTERT